jgi:zinc protease
VEPRSFTFGGGEAAIFHAVANGLRTYWIERDGPFRAVLTFRIGQSDEPLPKRGICHLVEHLAINPDQRLYTYNGWSSMDDTGFWAEGTQEEVLGYLGSVVRNLRELPEHRFEPETRILTTEGQDRGNSMSAVLLAARCGSVGYGAPSFPEYGLMRLTPGEAQEWADRYFVAENAVLSMTGPPPDGFALGLERGEPHNLPAPRSIDRLLLPTAIPAGSGAVGAGLMVGRGPATGIALGTLQARATQRLRYELGHSYNIWSDYQIAGESHAHLTVAADCTQAGTLATVAAFTEVIDEMADTGPEPASLAREVERFRRSVHEPLDALQWVASASVIGVSLEQLEEQYHALPQVEPADVAAIIREGAERMIMLVPLGVPTSGQRFKPYPYHSPQAVQGRRVRPTGLRRWFGARNAGLVIGEEGLSAVWADSTVTTIAWSECELVLEWPDGTVELVGCDGDRIGVPPQVFGTGAVARLREEIAQRLAAELHVRMR